MKRKDLIKGLIDEIFGGVRDFIDDLCMGDEENFEIDEPVFIIDMNIKPKHIHKSFNYAAVRRLFL